MLPSDVQSTLKLYLNKTLGYTTLIGVPIKLQPMFVSFTYKQNIGLYWTHGSATWITA